MGEQIDKFRVPLSPLHRYFTGRIPVQVQSVAHEMEKSTFLNESNIHVVEKKSCIQFYIKQTCKLLVVLKEPQFTGHVLLQMKRRTRS